ncbi:MAG: metallophosphoesterase family protein [Lachnospiraceae bacterium]|nr:metallophosphoesterase family protein [Lachnospiraceae bacterium]
MSFSYALDSSRSHARILHAFDDALVLPLTQRSRYLLISDCHRGVGNANDNFLKNEYLYLAALGFYYRRGFTYLELGDGDELWENRSFQKIKEMHLPSFEMLARFYSAGRMYSIYGNHDIIKQKERFRRKHLYTYYCERSCCERPLYPDMPFYEGIILRDEKCRKDIYLTHGHQSDPLNSTFWPLARFLVHYVWKPLEKLGIPDPTSAAKNNMKKKKSEQRLAAWAAASGHLLVTGHTHHPMIGTKHSPYCNTGSCIHPTGITCIEIENRCLTLVKWSMQAKADLTLYAKREALGETVCIDEFV